METITAFFSALSKGVQTAFNLAGMAVGIPPTTVPLADGATVPLRDDDDLDVRIDEMTADDVLHAYSGVNGFNPATGLPMLGPHGGSRDISGNLYGNG